MARYKYNRNSMSSVISAAHRMQQNNPGKMAYIVPTAYGLSLEYTKPSFGTYVVVNVDGTTKTVEPKFN